MERYTEAVVEKAKKQAIIIMGIRHQELSFYNGKISPIFYVVWFLLIIGFLIFAYTLIK